MRSKFEEFEKERKLLEGSASPEEQAQFAKERQHFLSQHSFDHHKEAIFKKAATESVEREMGKIIPIKSKNKIQKTLASLVAIAALLLISLKINQTPEPSHYIGSKGAYQFGFYVKQSDQNPKLGTNGLNLKENDIIRLFYESPDSKYLMIVSVEESGKINKHFPLNSELSQKIQGGSKQALETSLQLDSYQGKEKFIALFSEIPLEFDQVKEQIKNKIGQNEFFQQEQDLLDESSELSFWIQKQ